MELTNNWIDKGRIEGIQIGEKQLGEKLLLRQFNTKFGEVTSTIQDSLRRLNAAQMEDLGAALLGFSSMADAEVWLNEHLPASHH